jgi:hypothetical protein
MYEEFEASLDFERRHILQLKKKLRKERREVILRNRIIAVLLAILIIGIVGIFVSTGIQRAKERKEYYRYSTYVPNGWATYYTDVRVKYGDTVTSIAQYMIDNYETMDVPLEVEMNYIIQINNIPDYGDTIKSGEILICPYIGPDEKGSTASHIE